MMDEEFEQTDNRVVHKEGDAGRSGGRKSYRSLLILFVVFAVFVVVVFVFQRRDTINWVEDYEAGVALAKQRNKPILLAFYKQFTRMSSDMFQNTYNSPVVIKYVEENFIPILIDVDKHPAVAERYKVGYYPSHYVKLPDSEEAFGPRVGYDSPALFISELKKLLEKAEHASE